MQNDHKETKKKDNRDTKWLQKDAKQPYREEKLKQETEKMTADRQKTSTEDASFLLHKLVL